jgi:hypothetical protein
MNFLRKVNSIIPTYQKHGLDGLIYAILKNLKLNTKFVSIIDKKKHVIEKKIIKISNKTILGGLYKSAKLTCQTHWQGFDTSSKLLGLYEEQVQNKIVYLKKKFELEHLINFGSGDGYHMVGLIKNKHFNNGLAFEINEYGQKQIEENLRINNINQKVKIFKEANFDEIKKELSPQQLKKALFLVDIEGAEFELFNDHNIDVFKNSYLIIENHDFLSNQNTVNNFLKIMDKYFHLEILNNGPRNPFSIPEIKDLDDDEKWLIVSEGRKQSMNWLVFTPKDSQNA